jgi:uncharacterized protein
MPSIAQIIADELQAKDSQVTAAITLLDEGATVPFVARYRKEITGGLDDTQLRHLEQRLTYLRDMDARRLTILDSIREQGKLTPALEHQILDATSKTILEDLYLPYRPKRRTKGQIAIEAGLEPLANQLFENPQLDPETLARDFLNPEQQITETKQALDGARYILMERFAEEAQLIEQLRDYLWKNALLQAKVQKGKEQEGQKFADYFDHQEPLAKTPSHRTLAMLRGRNESILSLNLLVEQTGDRHPCEQKIATYFNIADRQRPADTWLLSVASWTWKVKLSIQLETELLNRLRDQAEEEAIRVFSHNLKDLLMAAPAGMKTTMGLDPGIRTGVKVAVVDQTGKVVATDTIYPFEPKKQYDASIETLHKLCVRHQVELISIGNGTASRETDRLAADLFKRYPDCHAQKMVVSEAGASVYSASELAANEFPDMDVSLRGAVSIARRLQDPLAELVKIEPKAIGVGQYQHDVSQNQLAQNLDAVVEDCVNAVGVDVNTASVPLLARVSGLSKTLAGNIVQHRDSNGPFQSRTELLKVARLGPKAYEQSAGFLRIQQGKNPLDASSVHPEAYPVVERISKTLQQPVSSLIGNSSVLRSLDARQFIDAQFGLPTVTDILQELDKPGRDPRPEFKMATFREGVETIKDLQPDMILEGVVTNVTNFGAFVDIGVHQDGLVHISALSHNYIKDPRDVVKAGDIVKVKVVEVDAPRKRIALTMRLDDTADRAAKTDTRPAPRASAKPTGTPSHVQSTRPERAASPAPANNAFAAAFANAKRKP